MLPSVSVWPLLLAASLLWTAAESSESNPNPKVIRLVFRNDSQPLDNLPDRLLPGAAARGNQPVVYCRDAQYPDDVYCDIGALLSDEDILPPDLVAFSANTAVPDPERPGKVCTVEFKSSDEGEVNPMSFEEIECGREREITSQSSDAPDGDIDSSAVLPRFSVSSMTDFLLSTYKSGFGCRHRLKRDRNAGRGTKNRVRGSLFKLDSFFCSFGFGLAEGRKETRYPSHTYYKYDGRRWRPSGIFPDYV